jgi:hypothetical protein
MVDFAPVGLGRSMAIIDQEVIISFKREDDSFAEYVYRPEALKTELDGIEAHLVGPSFLMEFEGGVLYTGGGVLFTVSTAHTRPGATTDRWCAQAVEPGHISAQGGYRRGALRWKNGGHSSAPGSRFPILLPKAPSGFELYPLAVPIPL